MKQLSFEIDPETGLGLGFGFDRVAVANKRQAHQDEVRVADDKTPEILNAKMDQLVESLGYLDYRDFLAVNKYVLEEMQNQREQAVIDQRDPA